MTGLYQSCRPRVAVISVSILILFLLLIGNLFNIQVIQYSRLACDASRMAGGWMNLTAARGNILDRNGIELTKNVTCYTFWVDTRKAFGKDEIVRLFSQTMGRPTAHYRQKLGQTGKYIVLEKDVTEVDCGQILMHSNIQGLNIDRITKRLYPYGDLAAQVIGTTDVVYDQNTERYDRCNGVSGIEKSCNGLLAAEAARCRISRNNSGQRHPTFGVRVPEVASGADVQLTLDISLQTILQRELKCALDSTQARSAHGIIIDPYTGAVLAMGNVPSFDLNHFQDYPIEYQENLTVSREYEPGSTLKVMAVGAALEEALLQPWDEFYCESGSYNYHNRMIHDYKPYETLNVAGILVHSSNIGVAKIADTLGMDILYERCINYGLGAPTGIRLPVENSGFLRPYTDWTVQSGPSVAMGHEVSTTSLQMAMIYAAYANGGYLLKPRIVESYVLPDGSRIVHEPEVIRQIESAGVTEIITTILEDAVTLGTGREAHIPGYRIAGKTGTAQIYTDGEYSHKEFMSSFAAYFPADNPKYVCVVAVERPQYGKHWGNLAAAPVVRRVFEQIISIDNDIPGTEGLFGNFAELHSSGQ